MKGPEESGEGCVQVLEVASRKLLAHQSASLRKNSSNSWPNLELLEGTADVEGGMYASQTRLVRKDQRIYGVLIASAPCPWTAYDYDVVQRSFQVDLPKGFFGSFDLCLLPMSPDA